MSAYARVLCSACMWYLFSVEWGRRTSFFWGFVSLICLSVMVACLSWLVPSFFVVPSAVITRKKLLQKKYQPLNDAQISSFIDRCAQYVGVRVQVTQTAAYFHGSLLNVAHCLWLVQRRGITFRQIDLCDKGVRVVVAARGMACC